MKDLQKLAAKIPLKKYNRIIVIGLGGMYPAYFLAKYLGISNLSLVVFNSYIDGKSGELKLKTKKLPTSYSSKILIVDDLVDSGKTLKEVKRWFPLAKTATLYKKDNSPAPDFFIQSFKNWIQFPWEKI